jgi:hypothetical protein
LKRLIFGKILANRDRQRASRFSPFPSSNWSPAMPTIPSHVQLLLDSFAQLLGRELIAREGSAAEQAEQLFQAPFVVVSHGTEADPILNYGNAAALALWEMSWEAFTQTPSRLTAEPVHREERAALLARTSENGYVDDYSGIRVTKCGRRFRIEQAIVWNLTDSTGSRRGQAACFDAWTPLDS